MRSSAIALGAAALLALGAFAPGTVASAAPAQSPTQQLARTLGLQLVPKDTPSARRGGPAEANPLLALTPDPSQINMSGWKAKIAAASAQRAAAANARPTVAAEPLLVDEQEPDALLGGNDSAASAERITAFGSASGRRPAARILGTLASPITGRSTGPNTEDDGSIPLAGDPGVVSKSQTTVVNAVIGDGPHSSAGDGSGDLDFYAIRGASAGQTLDVAVDTPASELDSILVVYDAAGTILASNDDGPLSVDSALTLTIPAAGDYFVMVTGYGALPADPFDSGSGDGAQSEGAYNVALALDAKDVDYYAVNLRAGDVLSGSVSGAAGRLTIFDPAGTEVFGSTLDASSIYPAASPLTGGGNAVVDHVAATSGRHYLRVAQGVGDYDVTLEVYRHGTQVAGTQTIFLDFDGARVNTGIFGGPGVRQLSPLSAFTGRWGITANQQNALINRIVATVTENLQQDFAGTGVRVRVLNSRDHADPWGSPNVSRLIIGGTIAESGVDTIGIAQSIDPGNFDTAETALILLDVVSGPASEEASFNAYLTPQSNRVRFVGTALGNIASHEAGHYLGNWHVDQYNDTLNLMDQGGNFPLLYGVGADGVGGTADDPDVDFGPDVLNPNEGFTGIENTTARTRWALTP